MNPLLLEIPLQLETERLILRAPHQTGDGKLVNQAIIASFHELKAWLPFAQELPSLEETEISLRKAHVNFLKRESFRFLIFDKDSCEFIGITSFEGINWDIPKCEIGYWINTGHSSKGYMTEAVKELANFAFNNLNFKRIENKMRINKL